MHALLLAICLAAISSESMAQPFQTYEGADALQVAGSGTRITSNGIDFWTTGRPSRPHRILGILVDARGKGILGGDPITSKAFAKRVREVGGDAVVVLSRDVDTRAVIFDQGIAAPVRRQTTRFLVVRYEDSPPQK